MQLTVAKRESESRKKVERRGGGGHRRAVFQLPVPPYYPPRNATAKAAYAMFPRRPASIYKTMVEIVLQGRSHHEQVRSWFRNLAKTPDWALILIEQELQKRIAEMTESLAEIKKERQGKTGPEIRY